MAIYKKRKKKERMHLYIDTELKKHLYNVSEHTGTAAAEIMRQALRKELDTHYSQHKDKPSL